MTENVDDKLFCEVGIDLGFLTEEVVNEALEAQKIDNAVGINTKRIGAYLLEKGHLTREQIGKILKLQERYAKSEANNILNNTNSGSHNHQSQGTSSTNSQQHSAPNKAFDEVYCSSCGKPIKAQAEICPLCGVRQAYRNTQKVAGASSVPIGPRSKSAFQGLAIFLGGLGVHNFYIGNNSRGVTQLLLSLLSAGALSPIVWIWAVVEAFTVTTDNDGAPLS